jgi:MFS family permease
VSAIVAPAAGRLSDRARGRWSGITWGVLLGCAGMILISTVNHPAALLSGVGLVSTGCAAVQTITPALVKEVNPRQESGALIGLLANSADLGMALAPLAAYSLVENLPLKTVYLLAGILLGVGLPLSWTVGRKKKPTSPGLSDDSPSRGLPPGEDAAQ